MYIYIYIYIFTIYYNIIGKSYEKNVGGANLRACVWYTYIHTHLWLMRYDQISVADLITLWF